MKIIFKTIVLVTLLALSIAIGVPHYIASSGTLANGEAQGSTIGWMEVGNLKGEELKSALTNAVNDWNAQNLTVSGGGSSIEVSSSTFQFDIESTVNQYEENYRKPWYAFWNNNTTVHLPLTVFPSEVVKDEIASVSTWDTDATYSNVELAASYLMTDEVEAVVIDTSLLETDRISLSLEAMPEGAMGINELVLALNDTVIDPQMSFSMIEQLGEAINLANREAINFVASNVYNAAVHVNSEILERHSQNEIPSYLKPGLEAKVEVLANEDLKFVNLSSQPIVLKLSMDDGKLMTEVYTPAKETEVSVTVAEDEKIQPRTITRYSKDLAIGQTKQVQQGKAGLRVTVYRTIYDEQKLVSDDYYPPVDRIIVKSSQQPEPAPSSDNVNNDSAYQVDLDGDGFPDEDISSENLPNNNEDNNGNQSDDSQNSGSNLGNIDSVTGGSTNNGSGTNNSKNNNTENQDDEEENLPPGSYYDKGGNLITP
ncbi:VanW family protein [Solibacillus isronensis]